MPLLVNYKTSVSDRSETNDNVDNTDHILVNLNHETNCSKPIVVFKRSGKSSFFFYNPILMERLTVCPECVVPAFVRDMDPQLFSRIQAVVPFNQSKESYLNFFSKSKIVSNTALLKSQRFGITLTLNSIKSTSFLVQK